VTHGAQAALVRDGVVRWTATRGVADVPSSIPVDDGTLFCLASLGKPLLAALTLSLVERDALTLDAPLETVLGELPGASAVTLRMLLTHTSGYPDLYEAPVLQSLVSHDASYDPDRPHTWEALRPGLAEPVAPGKRWEYSNTGYLVLTELLVRVLGGAEGLQRAWDAFVERGGIRPALSSRLLTFDRSSVEPGRLAHGYEQQDDGAFADAYAGVVATGVPTDLFGLPFGDGLFAGTAVGTALFLDALFVRRTLLAPATVDLMSEPTPQAAAADESVPDPRTYGMGTLKVDGLGGSWQGHQGRYAGFSTVGASHTATGTTLVVLTNTIADPVPAVTVWRALAEAL
jgi:CubicO group peptidase (beta-lactamase class C family)